MSPRLDPRGSRAEEIATQKHLLPGSVGLAQGHPPTKPPVAKKSSLHREGCFLTAAGFVGGRARASPTLPGRTSFRVAISTAADPQASRVKILTHPYTTAACVAAVVVVTTGRDSSRCRCHGSSRIRQLALDC